MLSRTSQYTWKTVSSAPAQRNLPQRIQLCFDWSLCCWVWHFFLTRRGAAFAINAATGFWYSWVVESRVSNTLSPRSFAFQRSCPAYISLLWWIGALSRTICKNFKALLRCLTKSSITAMTQSSLMFCSKMIHYFCERSQGHSSAGDGLAPAARVVAWDAATPLVIVLAGFSLPHGHRQVQFHRVLRASPEMPNAS